MAIDFTRIIKRNREAREQEAAADFPGREGMDDQLAELARSDPFGDDTEPPEAEERMDAQPPGVPMPSAKTAPERPALRPQATGRAVAPSVAAETAASGHGSGRPVPPEPPATPPHRTDGRPDITSRRLGEILVAMGAATDGQLHRALEYQRVQGGGKIGDLLVAAGFISSVDLDAALAAQSPADAPRPAAEAQSGRRPERAAQPLQDMGIAAGHLRLATERSRLTGEAVPVVLRDIGVVSAEQMAEAIARIEGIGFVSHEQLESVDYMALIAAGCGLDSWQHMLPLQLTEQGLVVAISIPAGYEAARKRWPDKTIQALLAADETLLTHYLRWFVPTSAWLDQALKQYVDAAAGNQVDAALLDTVITALLRHACYQGASALTFSRTLLTGVIRIEQDGIGQILRPVPTDLVRQLIDHLSRITGLTETSAPVAGSPLLPKTEAQSSDLLSRYAIRFERLKTAAGAAARLDIHDLYLEAAALPALGFDELTEHQLQRYVTGSSGLLLVNGPADSGLATIAASILHLVDPVERQVHTIEPLIQHRHGLWQQHELAVDGPFAKISQWLDLLQDKGVDVVLAGPLMQPADIRSLMAFTMAGHLGIGILETSDAMTAIARLRNFNIGMDTLATQLRGIVTVRRLRALCPHCRIADQRADVRAGLSLNFLQSLDPHPYRASTQGCTACGYTGYRGHRYIYELLDISHEVRKLVESDAPASRIGQAGVRPGYSLRDSGLKMVARGLVSMDEIDRVTAADTEPGGR